MDENAWASGQRINVAELLGTNDASQAALATGRSQFICGAAGLEPTGGIVARPKMEGARVHAAGSAGPGCVGPGAGPGRACSVAKCWPRGGGKPGTTNSVVESGVSMGRESRGHSLADRPEFSARTLGP